MIYKQKLINTSLSSADSNKYPQIYQNPVAYNTFIKKQKEILNQSKSPQKLKIERKNPLDSSSSANSQKSRK